MAHGSRRHDAAEFVSLSKRRSPEETDRAAGLMRIIYFWPGSVMVALGVIGLVMPLMPPLP